MFKIQGMKKFQITLTTFCLSLFLFGLASAHCEIPCGIYDDAARFASMREHITTIEKSMNQVNELSASPSEHANQLVRWVNNKETHADDFTHIVTWYFQAQRIKPDTTNYHQKLELLHRMQVHAMKAKQTTDTAHTDTLRSLVDEFEKVYNQK